MGLQPLDWAVIFVYLIGMIGLSAWLSLRQQDQKDYYLGGNDTGPLPIALSTLATQCSTNSLLGAPAFVAFMGGGGLVWLQYELALPFAMIGLMALLMPILRGLNLISIYAYLERRFSLKTRLTISAIFLLLRAFATGVTIYGVGLVLSLVMGIPFWVAVLVLGGVTVIYDMLGGMKAVILSDVIQVSVLISAILSATWLAFHLNGGWSETINTLGEARMKALDFTNWGLDFTDTAEMRTNYGFWPMFIGGFFLYLAYYGCDQTQAQRSLSTRNVNDTNRALFLGGILRFPIVLAYCLLGVGIGAYSLKNPEFIRSLVDAAGKTRIDLAVPVFVLDNFPAGMVGLVMVGLFAASMSSLDSTFNSMSAVTMQGYILRFRRKNLSKRTELYLSKATTFLWGSLSIIFSFMVGDIAETIIVAVNKIGSLVNGPILAVFLMGILSRRVNAQGALGGFATGMLINTGLWVFSPGVSWLWWNVFGLAGAVLAGLTISHFTPPPSPEQLEGNLAGNIRNQSGKLTGPSRWRWYYLGLTLYGFAIFLLLWNF